MPRSKSQEDAEPIFREAIIYNILGDHPRIAQCLSHGSTNYVDVKYYSNGDLLAYLQKNQSHIAPDLQLKWFQQIIEAVDHIKVYGVIHSDEALRQYFVDDDLSTRLGDFNSSHYPGHPVLGFEKASHCLPRDYEELNTVMSDLFALGSALYELIAGTNPYNELYPVESEAVMRSMTLLSSWLGLNDDGKRILRSRYYTLNRSPDVSCGLWWRFYYGMLEGRIFFSEGGALKMCSVG